MYRSKAWLWIVLAGLIGTGAAFATNFVDQGQPGTQGAWPVKPTGGGVGPIVVSSCNAKTPVAQTTILNATGSLCTGLSGSPNAGCTVVYTATDWVQWPNVTISISNTGANTIGNVLVEWSPDGTNYELWDDTTFASLATTATKSLALSGNSRRYLKIEAKSTSGSTAVVTITANDCG